MRGNKNGIVSKMAKIFGGTLYEIVSPRRRITLSALCMSLLSINRSGNGAVEYIINNQCRHA